MSQDIEEFRRRDDLNPPVGLQILEVLIPGDDVICPSLRRAGQDDIIFRVLLYDLYLRQR